MTSWNMHQRYPLLILYPWNILFCYIPNEQCHVAQQASITTCAYSLMLLSQYCSTVSTIIYIYMSFPGAAMSPLYMY